VVPFFRRKKKEERKTEGVRSEGAVKALSSEEPGEELVEIEEETEDMVSILSERMSGIENRMTKIDISISSLRREIDNLGKEIERIDSSLQDVLTLYEIVSNQINPFVDAFKSLDYNAIISRFEENEEKIREFEKGLSNLRKDLEILAFGRFDFDKLIDEFFEERIEKMISTRDIEEEEHTSEQEEGEENESNSGTD
jgi:flagellar protein FlaC